MFVGEVMSYPEVWVFSIVYKGNLDDGLDVTCTLSVTESDAGIFLTFFVVQD